jgi:hypothetical protein
MIYYLNNGLILEQLIVKVLREYFDTLGVSGYYKHVTVHVTNKHPFARLLLNQRKGVAPDMSLFPAIVIATESDGKPGELENLVEVTGIALTMDDLTPGAGEEKSPLEAQGYMLLTADKMAAIREAVASKGRVYGASTVVRRQDRIAIEIWAENIQMKNELYELVRLFVCGFMKEILENQYGANDLSIFDNTVYGQRSNNFNVEFGVDLAGALITFEADYAIEQTVIDTDLVDENIDFMEVINHVKGQAGTSRSVVIGGGDGAESGGDDTGE